MLKQACPGGSAGPLTQEQAQVCHQGRSALSAPVANAAADILVSDSEHRNSHDP